jgi:hypothetical protein
MQATDVVFWPWVGPRKPGRAPPGLDWEEYERMVVITFPTCVCDSYRARLTADRGRAGVEYVEALGASVVVCLS